MSKKRICVIQVVFERIIFGAEDPYLDPGVARSLHEALPTSDLSLLPKKGHWPQLDGAPEVAQLLLSIPPRLATGY